MIPHLAWSVISTVKTNFIIWETRDWSWKPANFNTKPLAETQWKRADTFKSTEALRKHETMPPFSSYTFPVVTVLRKRDGILNHQVSATFPNCGNTLFHPVMGHQDGCRVGNNWNWYKPRETCTWNTELRSKRSNRENGPTFLDLPLFQGIFQWDEPTKRFPVLLPNRNSRKFRLNASAPYHPGQLYQLCWRVSSCVIFFVTVQNLK